LSLPLYNHKEFDLGHRSSGFPYFILFKSEFCNKEFMIWATVSSWSFFFFFFFTDCIELLHLQCKKYNQSDFGIGHLVMSIYKVVSCAFGRGCLLWLVCFLGKTPLTFALFQFVLQGQTWLLLQVSLDFLLLYSSPLWWKGHLFSGVSSRRSW